MRAEDIERLQRLGPKSLSHLPPYAFDEAVAAILKVKQLEEERLLREGLYYIVLTDLSGATVASSRLGAEDNKDRIQAFVQATLEALHDTQLTNSALFVKDIGDAALFIFTAFADVLTWHRNLMARLTQLNADFDQYKEPAVWHMRTKTVVHVGEVSFSEDRDPVAQAVNEVFKIEKCFGPDDLGCTQHVFRVIQPVLRQHGLHGIRIGDEVLPGDEIATELWRLETIPGHE